MAKWSSVHLMFCEGPHDAAFLNRLLKKQLGFAREDLKLSELPYPIVNVLQQSFKTRAAEDLRLDMAKKFFLPDYLVARETVLVLVFNYGGSNRRANMLPFLDNVFALLQAPDFAGQKMPAYAYTIFADADAIGLDRARANISTDLAAVGGSMWLSGTWDDYKTTKAAMQSTVFGPAAAYIWKKWTDDSGTLEDIVLECLAGDAGVQATLEFLDKRFSWAPPAGASPDQVCATSVKRLKAAFCVEGQREKPGMSLSVVLDQSELLQPAALRQSAAVQDCLQFLRDWLAPEAETDAAPVPEALARGEE